MATGNRIVLLLAAFVWAGCGSTARPSGEDLAVDWSVLRNYQAEQGFVSRCQLTVENRGQSALPAAGWSLYFNSPPIREDSVQGAIRIRNINGDFFELSPTEGFVPLPAGKSRRFEFDTSYAIVSEASAAAGFYLVWRDGAGKESPPRPVAEETIGPFQRAEQLLRSPQDKIPVPTPESRYQQNEAVSLLKPDQFTPVVPTPSRLDKGKGGFRVVAETVIRRPGDLEGEADYLASSLQNRLGTRPRVEEGAGKGSGSIALRVGNVSVAGVERHAGDEAYRLRIGTDDVEIVGSDPAGVFYGVQSFLALFPVEVWRAPRESFEVPATLVEDAPRFHYRGMHLDVARNFQSKETVKKLINLMAAYKLNRFHFHLSDDEGWRLAIQALPELTEVGSRRGHTEDESDRLYPSLGSGPFPDPSQSHGSGHYSRDDFLEILRHAVSRHVEVIPEIDTPGHSRAAIKAMDSRRRRLEGERKEEEANRFALSDPGDKSVYRSVQDFDDNVMNVCQESTYRFVETVVDELVDLYRTAGAPLTTIHTGGDEVPHGVWEKSPACRALIESGQASGVASTDDLSNYFLRRVHAILAERGLVTAGWEEIALTRAREGEPKTPNPVFVDQNFRAYVWNSVWGWGNEANAYRLANAGYPVVLCNASNLYFDMAYDKDPLEPGLAWAAYVDTRTVFDFVPLDLYLSASTDRSGDPIDPARYQGAERPSEKGKKNILGIQAELWGETAKGSDRMEYLAVPKLLALAERAWAAQPVWVKIANPESRRKAQDADWNRFANALGQRELPRLDYRFGGVNYRLPPPGVKTIDGTEKANVAFPGLKVERTGEGWVTCDTRGRCRSMNSKP